MESANEAARSLHHGKQTQRHTGVTSNLPQRVYQHKHDVTDGFTSQYACKLLVYFETHGDMANAILREKQTKAGRRTTKISLIETTNPFWKDLYEDIL